MQGKQPVGQKSCARHANAGLAAFGKKWRSFGTNFWFYMKFNECRDNDIRTKTGLPCGERISAKVCSCACRKRRPIMGYKLSYTTGLLYARSSCMQWVVRVWTVGHWVVLVQVIYCSKCGWDLFSKDQRHPEEEIMSYSHSRKLDLAYSSFFSSPA